MGGLRGAVVAATTLAAIACGGDASTVAIPTVEVRDSSGVTVVTLAIDSPPPVRPVDPTPAVIIPSDGPDGAWRLFRISALRITERGDVVVGNRGENQVLRFDGSGRLAAASGREGSGPGEFTSLMDVAVVGDDALAVDFLPRRVTRFDPEGLYLEDFALGAEAGRPLELHWTPSGLVGASFDLPDEYRAGDRLSSVQRIARFTLYDPRGAVLRTITEAPGPVMHMVSQQVDGGFVTASVAPIVQHTTHHAILPATTGAELVVASTERWELQIHTLDGSLVRIVRAPGLDRPMTDEAWGERVAGRARELREDLADEARSALGVLDDLADAPRPATLPAFGRLVSGGDGRLWVGPASVPASGPATWLVLDSRTGDLDAFAFPGRFTLRAVRDGRAWGVLRDEFDVETIVAYSLPR